MGPPLEASATVSATCGSSRGKDEQPSSKRRRKSTDDTPIANTAAAAAPVDGSCAGAAGEMEGGEDGQKNEIRSMGEAENDQESKIGEVDMEKNMEEQAAGAKAQTERKRPSGPQRGDGPEEEEEAANEEIEDMEGEEEEEEEEEEDEDEDEEDDKAGKEKGQGVSGGEKNTEADAGGFNIARARSAWMIFLADNREKVREEHPGLAVGPMQKILSAMWKGLDEKESARYAELAMKEKARMKKELADAGLSRLPVKNSTPTSVDGSPTDLILPLARVRKTIRLDPGVGNISKEGLQLVAKATEVFMEVMADRSWRIGRQTGRKSVKPCDLAEYVFAAPEMYWLRDEFRSERSSVKKNSSKMDAGGKAGAGGKKAAAAVATGAKAITSFFKKA